MPTVIPVDHPASLNSIGAHLNIAAGATAYVQPASGIIYALTFLTLLQGNTGPRLGSYDGASTMPTWVSDAANGTNIVGTSSSFPAVFANNAVYFRVLNPGAGSVDIIYTGYQAPDLPIQIASSQTISATSYVSIQPAAGQVWQLLVPRRYAAYGDGNFHWYFYDGTTRVALPDTGSGMNLDLLANIILSNSLYLSVYNTTAGTINFSYQYLYL